MKSIMENDCGFPQLEELRSKETMDQKKFLKKKPKKPHSSMSWPGKKHLDPRLFEALHIKE